MVTNENGIPYKKDSGAITKVVMKNMKHIQEKFRNKFNKEPPLKTYCDLRKSFICKINSDGNYQNQLDLSRVLKHSMRVQEENYIISSNDEDEILPDEMPQELIDSQIQNYIDSYGEK